jgi:predicted DNA-binding transcriptional regulator YafY
MANTSTRTLRLLSLLQTHRYWPGEELADRLGVSVRTLRRDIDRLRELGYPVDAQRGVDGGYQLAAGAALPPLVIDDEEAVALVIGLQAAAEGAVAGIAEASVRVLAKVVQVMPARLRRRAEALRAMTVPDEWDGPAAADSGVDATALTVVALACRDAEQLRFGYTTADGRRAVREVEPHRLVFLDRRWYLVAHDLGRHDWRSFRLDRLADPVGTGGRFRPRELPGGDAAEFVRAGRNTVPRPYEVLAEVAAPAELVRERIGRWAVVEPVDAAGCRVRMSSEQAEWPVMALGVVGAEFRVLEPPELVAQVRAMGERLGRAAERSASQSEDRPAGRPAL